MVILIHPQVPRFLHKVFVPSITTLDMVLSSDGNLRRKRHVWGWSFITTVFNMGFPCKITYKLNTIPAIYEADQRGQK